MKIFQEKSPAGNEALNIISKNYYSQNRRKLQPENLEKDSILFEFRDENGEEKRAVLYGRYKVAVKFLHSMGQNGATVWDATYSNHNRLRYITQIIHIIRIDKGLGYYFISTEMEEVDGFYSPIARYRLTPSFRIIAERGV